MTEKEVRVDGEATSCGVRELHAREIDGIAGGGDDAGDGSGVVSGTPVLQARRSVRIERAYRK